MPTSRHCSEERCRQLRFFGSTGGHRYTRGHPRCERCKGTGVVTDDVAAQRIYFDGTPMKGEFRDYADQLKDFRSLGLGTPRR